jgi:PHD/YefM family antitoxin component YafN of YafNO toxin-antitoxin module
MDTPRPIEPTTDVDALAEAARHGPVTVHGAAGPAFVAVAPEAYARLAETERERFDKAGGALLAVLADVHARITAERTPEEIAREVAAIERELHDED